MALCRGLLSDPYLRTGGAGSATYFCVDVFYSVRFCFVDFSVIFVDTRFKEV